MPRKTKAKKRHADLYKLKSPVVSSIAAKPAHIPTKKTKIANEIEINETINKEDETITIATKNDLKKTIFITLAIFALEFTIFYASLKGISLK